jgi:hypothetical protein
MAKEFPTVFRIQLAKLLNISPNRVSELTKAGILPQLANVRSDTSRPTANADSSSTRRRTQHGWLSPATGHS